jgi:hypothetical protein
MMDQKIMKQRIADLARIAVPLAENEDYLVTLNSYIPDSDTLYIDVMPYAPSEWADIAYDFSKKPGMKYDRSHESFGMDGQPRVSYSGIVWVRFVSPFEDGTTLGQNIWADMWTHAQAEDQLSRYYGKFMEDGLEPMEVFKKFLF